MYVNKEDLKFLSTETSGEGCDMKWSNRGKFIFQNLRQHIGIGQAIVIDSLQIKWPATGRVQVFKNLRADMNIKIKETDNSFTAYELNKINFTSVRSGLISCSPNHK